MKETFRVITFIFSALFIISIGSSQETYSIPSKDKIDLNDWVVMNNTDQHLWTVDNGKATGGDGVISIPTNTYLCSTKTYDDFEFRCLFRLSGPPDDEGMINSGIQYRSSVIDGNMVGYQADIGNGYWGDIYDEHRRAKLMGGDLSVLKDFINENGWNSYIIRCKGNGHQLYINGIKVCEYVETDPNIPSKGIIGIQLHSGGKAKIELKNVSISQL